MRSFTLFDPGRAAEAFFLIPSSPGTDFSEASLEVLSRWEVALAKTGASRSNAMMTRIYVRGGRQAREALYATRLYREISRGAVSIVGQDPLEGGPIALFSQHILSPAKPSPVNICPAIGPRAAGNASAPIGTSLRGNYGHLWLAHPPDIADADDVAAQTTACLDSWRQALGSFGMDWAEHALRTWFFIDDIDRNYPGMVRSRLEFFREQGLTQNRRLPASTGIGAHRTGVGPGLTAEALALKGYAAGQIRAMRDEGNMPAAMSYGVSFERGIKVAFGDRIHCHISGTASIGSQGEILHPGDVGRQTEQALQNVESLLATEGLGLSHLTYLLVYVREASAAPIVRARLDRLLPETVPSLILEGAVCRPGWLVEVEGLGARAQPHPFPHFP